MLAKPHAVGGVVLPLLSWPQQTARLSSPRSAQTCFNPPARAVYPPPVGDPLICFLLS